MGFDLISFLTEYRIYFRSLHILAAALAVGTVTFSDIIFFRYLLKNKRILSAQAQLLKITSTIIWIVVAIILVSGAAMILPSLGAYLEDARIMAKVTIFGVIIVNGILLNIFLSPKLGQLSFVKEDLKKHLLTKRLAFIFGPISTTSWYTAFFVATLRNITLDYVQIIGIYILLLVGAVITGQVFVSFLQKR